MADKHPVDPLAELDALLRAELAVEPSHELLPRVRERIRTEPGPSRWRAFWTFAPALAVAAVVVVAIGVFVVSRENETSPAPLPIASAIPPTHAPATATPPLRDRFASRDQRAPNREERRAKSEQAHLRAAADKWRYGGQAAKGPEVLVDARQRDALLSFIEMARRGQVSAETFATTTPSPAVIKDEVKPIAVDDVAVSPVVAGGVLLFERERK